VVAAHRSDANRGSCRPQSFEGGTALAAVEDHDLGLGLTTTSERRQSALRREGEAMRLKHLFSIIAAAGTAACSGGPVCTADELTAALAEAGSGDTIEVGTCRVEGSFDVPAGVTLTGTDRLGSFVVGRSGAVVNLGEGAKLSNLTVESAGQAAVLTAAAATIEGALIRASLGIGVGVDRAPAVTLNDVQILGPVTAANAGGIGPADGGDVTATHGLVIAGVANAALTNVNVSGFARFGALLATSTTTWTGGGVSDTLGTALMVEAGAATLDGITLCRALQGIQLIPAYGGVFAGGARITSTRLDVCENEGFGILHDGSTAKHADLAGDTNRSAAVWVQRAASFDMTGALRGNAFAGLVAVGSNAVTIRNTQVTDTRKQIRIFDQRLTVEVGDGIQLLGRPQSVLLEGVSASGNSRVGVLFDLDGGTMPVDAIAGLELIATPDDALGVIAQNGTRTMGWDSNVQRDAVAQANDSAFAAALTTVGVVGPCRPALSNLGEAGLGSLVDPR